MATEKGNSAEVIRCEAKVVKALPNTQFDIEIENNGRTKRMRKAKQNALKITTLCWNNGEHSQKTQVLRKNLLKRYSLRKKNPPMELKQQKPNLFLAQWCPYNLISFGENHNNKLSSGSFGHPGRISCFNLIFS